MRASSTSLGRCTRPRSSSGRMGPSRCTAGEWGQLSIHLCLYQRAPRDVPSLTYPGNCQLPCTWCSLCIPPEAGRGWGGGNIHGYHGWPLCQVARSALLGLICSSWKSPWARQCATAACSTKARQNQWAPLGAERAPLAGNVPVAFPGSSEYVPMLQELLRCSQELL